MVGISMSNSMLKLMLKLYILNPQFITIKITSIIVTHGNIQTSLAFKTPENIHLFHVHFMKENTAIDPEMYEASL